MDVFIARQPIFDLKKDVYAYQLLYRSSFENIYTATDDDQSTAKVIINAFSLIGLEKLTGGKKFIVNFTRKLLENDIATLLPNDLMIIELKQNLNYDDSLLEAVLNFKEMGYKIAIDGTISTTKSKLFKIADIIKVDFLTTSQSERKEIISSSDNKNAIFIAEKIETLASFQEAKEEGFSYLQGYFFSKPQVLSTKDIKELGTNLIQLLQEINKEEIDFTALEKIIRMDVSLSYKLLKFINSAYFSFRTEIRSIKQALVLLGKKEIKKWISLLVVKEIADGKPDELLILALSRANFCEALAPVVGLESRKQDLFFLGLFSLIDVFLDKPMVNALMDLPLQEDIKSALLGRNNQLKKIYDMMIAYERGKFEMFVEIAQKTGASQTEIAKIYLKSLESSNSILG